MDITYEVTVDDLVQLNVHHLRSSPAVKLSLARQQASIAGFGALSMMFLWMTGGMPLYAAAIPMALMTALLVGRLPGRAERGAKALVSRSYSEGRNLGVLGPHRLVMTPEWIVDVNDFIERRIRWEAIERVDASDDHAFLYVGSNSALVVPRRAFPDDATFRHFVETARTHQKAIEARIPHLLTAPPRP